MKKTDNYFLISNYNQDPRYLLDYCNNYMIYDQSTDLNYAKLLSTLNYKKTKHTGHNISDYFSFFIENYDNLPDYIALLKGNIIGRHLSKEFFERVYNNKFYTFLYEDSNIRNKINKSIFFLSAENEYLEINNSWYVSHHPHKYFDNFNNLLNFVYKDPILPEYCLFSPGACYIVTKYQVLKNSVIFYKNLNKIISYTIEPKFPSEAHQVERMMHIIFSSNYKVNDFMNCEIQFEKEINFLEAKMNSMVDTKENNRYRKILWKIKSILRKSPVNG